MTGALAMVLVVTLPLLGALLSVMVGRGGQLGLAVVVGVGVALAVLITAVLQGGTVALAVGGWEAPLGITLRTDGLAGVFLVMTALVMSAVVILAQPQFQDRPESRASWAFWPLALLLWASLNAIFVSRDLFNLYVGSELLTIAAVALVAINTKAESLAAALRYMIFALFGSLLFLLGVALIYATHGTLDLALLAHRQTGARADLVAMTLMTIGLVAKTGLFPFHVWLPPAHANAPAPASAMLSALVPKASFYILIRLWFEVMPDMATTSILWVLGGLGAVAVIFGSIMALRQGRLKLIIAYSTVAQIGYLFFIFPLAGGESAMQTWAAGAWTGTVFQALSHGLAKAAMFLCAGLWIMAVGHDRLDGMRGLAVATPMTTFTFSLAAITLIGLPPSGGFIAKYLVLTSAFASGQTFWAVLLLAGGLLAAAYLYRPLELIFSRADRIDLRPVPRALQAVPLMLVLVAILLGLASAGPFDFLQIGKPVIAVEGLK